MVMATGPDESFGGWEYLAPEGPYAELILAQTEEILENYDVDGIWYDIHQPEWLNYNTYSMGDMKARGIDPDNLEEVSIRNVQKYNDFFRRTHDLIMAYKADATLYYNGTTRTYNDENISLFKYNFEKYNTKHDLEDLPTAWGGYDIFPWRSKYFANTGKEIVAMSGKFHKAWGEFGGFKDKDALLYEAASMIAFGANANIGDQLHPSGLMDISTYENIGYAFDYVEKIEAYGIGGKSIARTGLYTSESKAAIEGTVQMLLEEQINFNVVNTLEDWSDIEVLILTSGGVLDKDLPRVRAFMDRGGKVLAMGSGVFVDGQPVIDIGATYLGESGFDVDYTVIGGQLSKSIVSSPYLNYKPAIRVSPEEGTEVLASIHEPFFSRTLEHYSSHKNTPYRLEEASHPAVIRNENVIYIAHDLDKIYFAEGARIHRQLFVNALNLLRENPMVEVEMPSMGRVIEDLIPLNNIPVSMDVDESIRRAYMVPSGKKLKLKKTDGKLKVLVPEFTCHTGIVFEY